MTTSSPISSDRNVEGGQYFREKSKVPDTTGRKCTVQVQVVRSFENESLDSMVWNSLVAVSGGTIFQTYEWQSLWWRHFGDHGILNILVFNADGTTVGIAPLFRERARGTLGRSLRMIGSGTAYSRSGRLFLDDGPSDYLDFIVIPEFCAIVADSFREFLEIDGHTIDKIDLVNLRRDGIVISEIIPRMKSPRLNVDISDGEIHSSIKCRLDVGEYINNLNSSVRRRLRQAQKLLNDSDGSGRAGYPNQDDHNLFLDNLIRLHQQRWNKAGFPGTFSDRRYRNFMRDLCDAFSDHGWLWYSSIYASGTCLATRLGFKFHGRMYDYMSGFDGSSPLTRKRPGLALLLEMYESGHQEGLISIDLLRGDEQYKVEMGGESELLANVTIRTKGPFRIFRTIWSRIHFLIHFILFVGEKEFRLFSVQVNHHGYFRGIWCYLVFRIDRLYNKVLKTRFTW